MKTYFLALIVLIATLVAHIAGIHGLYMQFPSYDILMHILGGVGIGLSITAFMKSNLQQLKNKRAKLILGVFVIGIIWELFEAYFNIAGAPVGTVAYFIDTAKDLLDDVVGGSIVAWICFRK